MDYILTDNSLTVVVDGIPRTVFAHESHFENCLSALREQNFDKLKRLIDKTTQVKEFFLDDNFRVKDDIIYGPDNKPLSDLLTKRILSMIDNDIPYHTLLNFWKRLMKNPEESSRNQLYRFLEHNHITITSDGYILAYKGVTRDLRDRHSGKIKYKLNKWVSMPRKEVVCDPNEPCGPGLHVGTYDYASGWAGVDGKVLLVLVDPKDVVSVPKDLDSSKCRTCRLKPLEIVKFEEEESQSSVYKIGHLEFTAQKVKSLKDGLKRMKPSRWPVIFKKEKNKYKAIFKSTDEYFVVLQDDTILKLSRRK